CAQVQYGSSGYPKRCLHIGVYARANQGSDPMTMRRLSIHTHLRVGLVIAGTCFHSVDGDMLHDSTADAKLYFAPRTNALSDRARHMKFDALGFGIYQGK